MNAPDQIPTKPVTLAQLLDRALVHLDTAREDVQAAADSLPNGSKAEHALPQLGEVAHYLREAAKAAAAILTLPGLPPASELGPLADPNLVADAAMALTRRLGFDWCGYQVGMHDSKPIPLIKLQGDAKP